MGAPSEADEQSGLAGAPQPPLADSGGQLVGWLTHRSLLSAYPQRLGSCAAPGDQPAASR